MHEQTKKITDWLAAGSINIFGCPFAGKDTQARILAQLFNGALIAGGDILRSHHDPVKIKQIMAEGGLVPSDFYLHLVLPYLSRPIFKNKPLILSSVGRSKGEESTIVEATNASGHPLKAVILLELPEDEVWRRFEAAKAEHDRDGRTDDQRKTLKKRLTKFKDKTMPVIEFYRSKDLLIEVNGALSREEVTKEILKKLGQKAKVG
jgi:adenylate kinase